MAAPRHPANVSRNRIKIRSRSPFSKPCPVKEEWQHTEFTADAADRYFRLFRGVFGAKPPTSQTGA